jgi:hypothetical protein
MLDSGEIAERFFGATESGSPAPDAHRASFAPICIYSFAPRTIKETFPYSLHVRTDGSGGGGGTRSTRSQVIADPTM